MKTMVPVETEHGPEEIAYTTSQVYTIQVEVDDAEIISIKSSYESDKHFQKVSKQLEKEQKEEIPREKSLFQQY